MKLKTLLEAIKDCDNEASVVYNGEGIFIVDGRKIIQIRDPDNEDLDNNLHEEESIEDVEEIDKMLLTLANMRNKIAGY